MNEPMTQQRLDEIREEEEWKNVEGCDGRYLISNLGNVASVSERYKGVSPRELKPRIDRRGYLVVSLRNRGRNETRSVHRLVAEQFIPNTDDKPQVNHINGIKTDNRASNLEWVTNGENAVHAYRLGLNTRDALIKPVVQIDPLSYVTIAKYSSMMEAERATGVSNSKICGCCKRRPMYRTAGGYVWRYAR